jgi:hypothetical protein
VRGSPEGISGNPIRVSNSAWLRLVSSTPDIYSSTFIPDEVEHIIGKGRNHEMRGSNSSSSKTHFKGSNVADNKDKGNFRGKCVIRSRIVEVLLRNRKRSCLAYNQICNLAANNRDQESALCIFICLY